MVSPPGGRAFRDLATGITMGAAPMKEPSVKSLNGGRVAILKSDVPYAHFCMGIRTIAARARGPTRAQCRHMAGWSRVVTPCSQQRQCLSPDEVRRFVVDGYVVIHDWADPAQLAEARNRVWSDAECGLARVPRLQKDAPQDA